MKKAKHCDICENQLYDFKSGTICALSNKRPNFSSKCDKITLDDKYKKKIKEVNVQYQMLFRKRTKVTSTFIIHLSACLALMLAGILLGIIISSKGIIDKLPFIIAGAGLAMMPKAFGPFTKYRQSITVARSNKLELDQILEKYNVKYEIDILFKTDWHGNVTANPQLTFLRKHYK